MGNRVYFIVEYHNMSITDAKERRREKEGSCVFPIVGFLLPSDVLFLVLSSFACVVAGAHFVYCYLCRSSRSQKTARRMWNRVRKSTCKLALEFDEKAGIL